MKQYEQRELALMVLDDITDWNEYKQVLAAFTAVHIFTDFEMLMFARVKCEELKEKGLI